MYRSVRLGTGKIELGWDRVEGVRGQRVEDLVICQFSR